jgi:hypothetical protein
MPKPERRTCAPGAKKCQKMAAGRFIQNPDADFGQMKAGPFMIRRNAVKMRAFRTKLLVGFSLLALQNLFLVLTPQRMNYVDLDS